MPYKNAIYGADLSPLYTRRTNQARHLFRSIVYNTDNVYLPMRNQQLSVSRDVV